MLVAILVILALLCVSASPSHGVESDNVEYRHGRFDRRIPIPSRNGSVTAVAISSLDILVASSTVVNSETYQNSIATVSIPTITTPVEDVPTAVVLSEDNDVSSEVDTWWTLLNLGTITTIKRPPLVLPTATSTRSIPRPPVQPAVSSLEPIFDTNTETYLPPTASSFVLNATSKPWSWNATSHGSSPLAPTVALPPTTAPPASKTNTPSECPVVTGPVTVTITSYSIIHTSTTTWTGDPADYSPPYPPISTPPEAPGCTPKESPTGRLTISFCDSSGKSCTFIHTTTNGFVPTRTVAGTQTVIFVTTDKNPAVVFPTETPPSYGGSPSNPNGHHPAVEDGSAISTPEYGMLPSNVESAKSSPTPAGKNNPGPTPTPITVIVQPGGVVVNDRTFTDNPTQKTSTVVVGTDTFVIGPSKVVGVGATVNRPPSSIGGVFVPTPTAITTSIGGLGVVYGPSIATIDGTVFTIKPTPTSAVIKGQTITLGPAGIIFPTQTLHVAAGLVPTQTAVMGGELITAIGSDTVVIEGTTITYGPDFGSTVTTVIDGDTILIAPTGVLVHNEILGGITAAPTATTYDIVGGATVTQLGLNAVEIGGKTYHIGLGTPMVTTVINGQTLTIGPNGVAMSTWTLGAPYASTTTLRPSVGNNAAMTMPAATESAENSGPITRPDWARELPVLLCVVIGAGCLGQCLFWL
ncbi:hypothetical protein AAE478_001856 [Parahypoxylon ruwenzoriense]